MKQICPYVSTDVCRVSAVGRRAPARARLVVAAEVDAQWGPQARAVQDLRPVTELHGVSSCGYLIEHLTVIPDMQWVEVATRSRCAFCQADAAWS